MDDWKAARYVEKEVVREQIDTLCLGYRAVDAISAALLTSQLARNKAPAAMLSGCPISVKSLTPLAKFTDCSVIRPPWLG